MARIVETSNTLTTPVWAGDYLSRDHLIPGGYKVDPAQFNDTDAVIATVDTGGAAIGATSVPVTALSGAIPSGTMLNFGTWAPVTVTVSDASISAGETSFGVTALSGPIPAGTVLDFSGGTNAQLAKLSADAAQGATTLTVFPLDGTIANGQTATFAGGTKQARLTSAAAAGATSLVVDELQFALVAGNTATYPGAGTGLKTIRSGKVLGWTYTERNGTPPLLLGPAADTDDEVLILAFDIVDADTNNDAVIYRPGSVVKENYLPDYATLSATVLAKVRAAYQTIKGSN